MTDAERAGWQRLRNRRLLNWKFRRQHPIKNCMVDPVCTDAGMIVELDAGQHVVQGERDAFRTARWCALGYRVVRFWNDAVLMNMDQALEVIVRELDTPPHRVRATVTSGDGRQDRA